MYDAKAQPYSHMPLILISYKIYEMKISEAYFRLASAGSTNIKMEIDVQYRNKYD
jgi:hypothetical protein